MKEKWNELVRRLTAGGATRLWLLLGLAGILLIGLSECRPFRQEKAEDTVTLTAAQVEQALEERIASLLSSVEGVGSCQVMVTLESTAQAVYAASTVTDSVGTLSEEYLTVDTDEGPRGLLLTTLPPSVKGVAVVCDGGNNETVCQQVIQVVSTAFHISERRVCVAALK